MTKGRGAPVDGMCARNGTATAFRIRGEGPAVVLAHGAEADQRMFDHIVGDLATALTVITYDQRDCGASTTITDRYTLEDLADDMVALLDHLELAQTHIVGQSLGGVIAQLVAANHPTRVDRLVLASTFRAGVSLAEINPAGISRLLALREHGTDRERAELFLTPQFVRDVPGAIETWNSSAPTTTPEQQARRTDAMRQPIPPVALDTILAPTLVIHGTADMIVPFSHAADNARGIPNSRLVELEDVGHVSPVQAPLDFAAAVLEHLTNTTPSAP